MKAFDILRVRPFRMLWIGQAVSQFGDALYFFVFLYMVDRLTKDPTQVGLVMAIQAIPMLLLSPYAGTLADRMDRRKIMIASDVASLAVMALLGVVILLNPNPPIRVIFVAAFLLSLVNVFFLPAKSASIPRLVPPERLLEANSLSQATQTLMPLIGLSLSAGVLAGLDKIFPNFFFLSAIAINGITFAVSAAFLTKLPSIIPDRGELGVLHDSHWQMTLEGLRYAKEDLLIRTVTILGFLLNFFIGPFMLVYVAVNREWFGGEFWTLAVVECSFAGVMLVTSLFLGTRHVRYPTRLAIIGLIQIGVFLFLMGVSRNYALFVLWNLLCGIGVPLQIPLNTYLQKITPDAMRGRVMSLLAMVSSVAIPLSAAAGGLVLHEVGAGIMFYIMGLGFIFTGFWAFFVRGFWRIEDSGNHPASN